MNHPRRLLRVPGSKSVTHRAFVLAASCVDGAIVRQPLLSGDTRSTLASLRSIGASWHIDANGDVHFAEKRPCESAATLDCGNSGTTLRLLAGQAARLTHPITLTGDASLQKRPNGPLLDALAQLGASTVSTDGRCPLTITGPVTAADVDMPANISSQYISSLLLALAMADGETARLSAQRPVSSRPYLDITTDVASAFGLSWHVDEAEALTFDVPARQVPTAPTGGFVVEADWSTAAFPLVAAALSGISVGIEGLRRSSAQGDRAVVDVLARFGVRIAWRSTDNGDVLEMDPAPLQAVEHIDVFATPDMFPALCALAACSAGSTRIDGAPSLRHKECDRIAAMVTGLRTLGVTVQELDDGAIITGGSIGAGAVQSHDDHRIHMAFSLLNLRCEGRIDVDHPDCVAISYPAFHDDLATLTAWSATP